MGRSEDSPGQVADQAAAVALDSLAIGSLAQPVLQRYRRHFGLAGLCPYDWRDDRELVSATCLVVTATRSQATESRRGRADCARHPFFQFGAPEGHIACTRRSATRHGSACR